jgi:protein-arginine kinase activator protein McsA
MAKLHRLKIALHQAIAEEAYENAAKFRDEIQACEEAAESQSVQP